MSGPDLLKHALDLPAEDRAAMAFRLLESLDPEDDTDLCGSEEEWEDAWAVEISARLARDEDGIDAHVLISRLRSAGAKPG